MSSVEVSIFKDRATGDDVEAKYIVHGSAKSWANLNGTGTIALRDSLNVSSVTDLGVGEYQFNYSNAMANANYSDQAKAGQTGSTHGITLTASALVASTSFLTTSSTFTSTDTSRFVLELLGDLA